MFSTLDRDRLSLPHRDSVTYTPTSYQAERIRETFILVNMTEFERDFVGQTVKGARECDMSSLMPDLVF